MQYYTALHGAYMVATAGDIKFQVVARPKLFFVPAVSLSVDDDVHSAVTTTKTKKAKTKVTPGTNGKQ